MMMMLMISVMVGWYSWGRLQLAEVAVGARVGLLFVELSDAKQFVMHHIVATLCCVFLFMLSIRF